MLAVLALGLAMLLSSLYVRYRDIEPIWDVVLQALFYASPILYTVDAASSTKAGEGAVKLLLLLNPFAAIVQEGKHLLVDPSHPSAAAAMGSGALVLVPLIATLAVLGARLRRLRPRGAAHRRGPLAPFTAHRQPGRAHACGPVALARVLQPGRKRRLRYERLRRWRNLQTLRLPSLTTPSGTKPAFSRTRTDALRSGSVWAMTAFTSGAA